MSASLGIWATLNTTYRCNSVASFNVGGVTVTFQNTRLQAYMLGNDLSLTGSAGERRRAADFAFAQPTATDLRVIAETVCVADHATIAPPPTTSTTTTTPATTTTVAPAPTPPGRPEGGKYPVLNGTGTPCLLADMALQLNVSYFSRSENKVSEEDGASGCTHRKEKQHRHQKYLLCIYQDGPVAGEPEPEAGELVGIV